MPPPKAGQTRKPTKHGRSSMSKPDEKQKRRKIVEDEIEMMLASERISSDELGDLVDDVEVLLEEIDAVQDLDRMERVKIVCVY
jgi:hypothetical protein